MDKKLYVMFIIRGKTYNTMNRAAVERHVDNIRRLDDEGHMERCGVVKGYPGIAGMVILRAENREAAEALCKREPLVQEGFATYKLCEFMEGTRENNYLL